MRLGIPSRLARPATVVAVVLNVGTSVCQMVGVLVAGKFILRVVLGRVPGSSALSGCRQAGVTGVLGVVRLSTGVARLSTAVPTVTTSRRLG